MDLRAIAHWKDSRKTAICAFAYILLVFTGHVPSMIVRAHNVCCIPDADILAIVPHLPGLVAPQQSSGFTVYAGDSQVFGG